LKSILIITVSLFAVSLSVQAAKPSLESCAAIEDQFERLACYDTLAGRLPDGTSKARGTEPGAVDPAAPRADVTVSSAPAVTPTVTEVEPEPDAEASFGFENKQKPEGKQLDELQLKWTMKKRDGYGKWIITLENGQVWHQIDSRRFYFDNPEQWVVIYRGVFGSFFMGEPERRNGIRVKRVK
jgi:hypothetical protein